METKTSNMLNLVRKHKFIITCFLCLLITISSLWLKNYAIILYVFLSIITALFFDVNQIVILSGYGIFFQRMFGHDVFKALIVLFFVLFIKCLKDLVTKKIKLKKSYIIPFFILCILGVMFLCINFKYNQIFRIFEVVGCLFFVFELYLLKEELNVVKIIKGFAVIMIISCLISLIFNAVHLKVEAFSIDGIGIKRFRGSMPHANWLAVWCSALLSFYIVLFYQRKVGFLEFVLFDLLFIVFGLLTKSKTFLIIFALAVLLYLILSFVKNKKFALIQIIVSVIIIGVFSYVFKDKIMELGSRFLGYSKNTDIINRLTTGRYKIWQKYFNIWSSSSLYILFGFGGSFAENIHNSYLEVLFKYGTIGFLLVTGYIVYFIWDSRKNKKLRFDSFIPLVIIAFCMMVEVFSKSAVVLLVLSVFMLFSFERVNENKSILCYSSSFINGSKGQYVMDIVKNLHSKYNFDILTNCDYQVPFNIEHRMDKIDCAIFNIYSKCFIVEYVKLVSFFIKNKGKYDVVHINAENHAAGVIAYIAKVYGQVRKVIFHSHVQNKNTNGSRLNRSIWTYLAIEYSDEYIASSLTSFSNMYGDDFEKKHKVKLLYKPIDLNKFLFNKTTRERYRSKYNLIDNFVVLSEYNDLEQSNVEKLIKVFRAISKKDTNAKFVLVGNGKFEKLAQNVFSDNNLQDKIIFLHNKKDFYIATQMSDVFVMIGSTDEDLSKLALGVQASGIPTIVSSNISMEYNIVNQCTFVPIENSVTKWANAILKFKNYERKNVDDKVLDKKLDNKSAMIEVDEIYKNVKERM